MGNPVPASNARSDALEAAQRELEIARQKRVISDPHRAFGTLAISPSSVLHAVALTTFLCTGLWWLQPQLLGFWRECMLFWADMLNIPLHPAAQMTVPFQLGLEWRSPDSMPDLPSPAAWTVTAIATALAFGASFAMKGAMLPLCYLLRILCTIQAVALAYFWFAPQDFPYSVRSHLLDMVSMGYVLLMATPPMLALGYYLLNVPLRAKLGYTLLIMAYFVVMVPFQVVLHILVLQHFSVLFMPVLYICFGAVFDILVFIALYSWVASMAPRGAIR
jgi:hypothetical protein